MKTPAKLGQALAIVWALMGCGDEESATERSWKESAAREHRMSVEKAVTTGKQRMYDVALEQDVTQEMVSAERELLSTLMESLGIPSGENAENSSTRCASGNNPEKAYKKARFRAHAALETSLGGEPGPLL